MTETRVYRLDVIYPPGSLEWGWEPPGWDGWGDERASAHPEDGGPAPFQWPSVRRYLSRRGAETRAALLRKYGAIVTVVASNPVTWPETEERR